MRAYNWKEYSEAYCEKIKCIECNEDNTLMIYEAFNKAVWSVQYFIIYNGKVIKEEYDINFILNHYYGMYLLLKHLKEEKEIIEDNQKLYTIVQYDFASGGYLQYAIDGLIFNSEKTAEEYRKIKPDYDSTGVEEVILYSNKE